MSCGEGVELCRLFEQEALLWGACGGRALVETLGSESRETARVVTPGDTVDYDRLLEAHCRARFVTAGGEGGLTTILVGKPSAGVDRLVSTFNYRTWAWIADFGPTDLGVRLDRKYIVSRGEVIDPEWEWLPSCGWLILGISSPAAEEIGRRHRQLAVVCGEREGTAELHVLDRSRASLDAYATHGNFEQRERAEGLFYNGRRRDGVLFHPRRFVGRPPRIPRSATCLLYESPGRSSDHTSPFDLSVSSNRSRSHWYLWVTSQKLDAIAAGESPWSIDVEASIPKSGLSRRQGAQKLVRAWYDGRRWSKSVYGSPDEEPVVTAASSLIDSAELERIIEETWNGDS